MARGKISSQKKKVPNLRKAVPVDNSDHWLIFLRKYSLIIICLLLTFTICLVYFQVKNHQFINYDDQVYVQGNIHVITGLKFENIKWAFTSVYAGNWHPLTWISHMVDVDLFGLNPGMHHLTNVIFHILNSILLFIVLNMMTRALWRSAVVAVFFALHPLHVESVAWIAERKDVLSTFFWILTMLAYYRYVISRKISNYFLMIMFFVLGLMSKPMLVTLPFVLLLMDFWPLNRRELNFMTNETITASLWSEVNSRGIISLILEKTPLMIIALASCGVTFYAQSGAEAVTSLDQMSFAVRISNAINSYVIYLWKMVWPLDLAVFYPYPGQINLLMVLIHLLLIILITMVVIKYMRKFPYLATGWFWYLVTLVPVIGIVHVGSQSMADRYTYIPLIGIFIMISWGISRLFDRWHLKKIVFATITAIVIPILILCSWIQVSYWKNSFSLFEHALNVTENNYVPHRNLALAYMNQGDYDNALLHCTEALELLPDYAEAYNNMGTILIKRGEISKAISIFNKAIQINQNDLYAYKYLGQIFINQGNNSEAIKILSKAIEIEPRDFSLYINMGVALTNLNRLNEAIYQYNKAIHIKPDSLEAHYNLAITLLSLGKKDEAIHQFNLVLGIDPGNTQAKNILSMISQKKN